jgi:hypothetical protein
MLFSRKTWLYFLKKKSKFFEKLKQFKTLIENQKEKENKSTEDYDNGGDLCGNILSSLVKSAE